MTPHVVHAASGREWRGGERQVWLLARELARRGIVKQTLVTQAGSELARRARADGVPVREVPWRMGLDPRAGRALYDELGRHPSTTPLVLHAHDAHAVTVGGIAARLRRVPLIATRRTAFHLRRPGFWARASCVVAISDAVRAILIEDGIAPGRIAVIPSAIDLDDVATAAPNGYRERLDVPKDAPLAVNLGALTDEKGHCFLVEAAALARAEAPNLHWAIAGEGPLRPALADRIRHLRLGDRVHLLGHITDAPSLLAEATLFVMPSTHEGLGTAVLDALAQHVPVVATTVGGIPEMLAGGAGRLVPPSDPAALAQAVLEVSTDASLRAKLSLAGDGAIRRYDVRGMAERLASVYRSSAPLH